MFREEALYFRKIAVKKNEAVEKTIQKELLLALESARTRLAIAIASEKKSTLPDRWQYYLDTLDQMRHFIRKLRKTENRASAIKGWICALEALRSISAQEQAIHLCRILSRIVAELELEVQAPEDWVVRN
jgi:hypothetical protein